MDSKDDKIKKLQDELALYKLNGPVGLYYELNRFVNNTIEVMRNQNLKTLIAASEDDPKKFEKMMALL